MRTEQRRLDGPVDFELGRPRAAPLTYTISWPDSGAAQGLVFLIPGFGGDTDPAYGEALRRHLVEHHGVAAVSVRYHCFEARPTNGARVTIEAREHLMLIGMATISNVAVENYADLRALSEGLGAAGQTVHAYAKLEPGQGEYQNFGVLQAMDHLAVLGDLFARGPDFDRRRIVALGSSHGGYIAHLMAKIAPGVLSAVIDNSSYVRPPMNYLGLGAHAEYVDRLGGVVLMCRVASGWRQDDRAAPDFYGRDQDLVRDLGWPPHLQASRAAAGARSTAYFMVNSVEDGISRPQPKLRQAAALREAGFAARLDLIGPEEVDGQLFKSLDHGLKASLKGLLDRYLAQHPQVDGLPEPSAEGEAAYDCTDVRYRFVRTREAPYVRGEIEPLYRFETEDPAPAADQRVPA